MNRKWVIEARKPRGREGKERVERLVLTAAC